MRRSIARTGSRSSGPHVTKARKLEVAFDIDDLEMFCQHGLYYTKKKLEGPAKEVVFRHLNMEHKRLFEEAMAQEVCEVLKAQAVRAVITDAEQREVNAHPERIMAMRWILTWKTLAVPQVPKPGEPTTVTADGTRKAKARVVLIGYKHPDLTRRNEATGKLELVTNWAQSTTTERGRGRVYS
jgi:hypothetical protein